MHVSTQPQPRQGQGLVREIGLPDEALSFSDLPRVDYTDSFLIDPGLAPERSPLDWMRAVLEGAPSSFRDRAPRMWLALGLKHGPATGSPDHVLGWPIRGADDEHALLGAESRLGMPAELLVFRHEGELVFATLVRLGNPVMRGIWSVITPYHRDTVKRLLRRAARG